MMGRGVWLVGGACLGCMVRHVPLFGVFKIRSRAPVVARACSRRAFLHPVLAVSSQCMRGRVCIRCLCCSVLSIIINCGSK